MVKFRIKLKKRNLGNHIVYDIIVSRIVNRNSVDALEVLGTYSATYPSKYAFINVERLSYWIYCGAAVSHSASKLLSYIFLKG